MTNKELAAQCLIEAADLLKNKNHVDYSIDESEKHNYKFEPSKIDKRLSSMYYKGKFIGNLDSNDNWLYEMKEHQKSIGNIK